MTRYCVHILNVWQIYGEMQPKMFKNILFKNLRGRSDTGCFKKKLTLGFSTSPLNISADSHIITISINYMIKYIQLAIIQAFTAH